MILVRNNEFLPFVLRYNGFWMGVVGSPIISNRIFHFTKSWAYAIDGNVMHYNQNHYAISAYPTYSVDIAVDDNAFFFLRGTRVWIYRASNCQWSHRLYKSICVLFCFVAPSESVGNYLSNYDAQTGCLGFCCFHGGGLKSANNRNSLRCSRKGILQKWTIYKKITWYNVAFACQVLYVNNPFICVRFL